MRTGQLWSSYYSHCQGPSPPPQRPGEHAVQRGGEGLPVFGTVGARPAGDDARAPQVIHEVAHGEALADVVLRVLPAPGIEHGDALFHQAGGEGDVRGDGDVARLGVLGDVTVGDVRASLHPYDGDVGMVERGREPLVGDQDRLQLEPPGGPVDDLLDVPRRGVGIDPELHEPAGAPAARQTPRSSASPSSSARTFSGRPAAASTASAFSLPQPAARAFRRVLRRWPKARRTMATKAGMSLSGSGGACRVRPTKALSTLGGGRKLPGFTRPRRRASA